MTQPTLLASLLLVATLGLSAKAAELEPNHAAAHVALGELLAERGDTAEAVKRFRTALDLNPDEPTAKESLDRLEKQLRKEPGADSKRAPPGR